MFREKVRFFIQLDIILDIILTAISFILAIITREAYFYGGVEIKDLFLLFRQYAWVLLIAYPFLITSLFFGGAYGPLRFRPLYSVSWMVARSFLFTILSLVFILFIFKIHFVSRILLMAFGIIGTGLFILKKFLEISFLQFFRQKGFNLKYIVLAGERQDFANIISKIDQNPEYGLEIVALVTFDKKESIDKKEGITLPAYHGLRGLAAVLKEKVVDYILFTSYREKEEDIEKALSLCERHGVEAWLVADFFHMKIAQQDTDDFFGTPVIVFRSSPKFSGNLIIKRALDILISLLLLLLNLPLFILIAIAIKFDSRGPVIFAQKRGGLNGRIFTLYKFRSMVSEAEQRKQELERFNEMSGPVFKITNDPRVTKVGKFLRRFSLDELPQLFNVLKGEMSLVGPRPLPDYEVEKLIGGQRRRLRMRPGLTCLWQIRGRSDTDFTKWMKYDLEYIDSWSLGLDFYILFKTALVVLSRRGAY